MERCSICESIVEIPHYHHVVPQARGGTDGPTVVLCPSCHNCLHANALGVISKIKGNKKSLKSYWKTSELEERAKPYLQVLVKALLMPLPDKVKRKHQLTAQVSTEVFMMLKHLQKDLGLSSMEKTVLYCVHEILREKGIDNEAYKKQRTEMWYMHLSD